MVVVITILTIGLPFYTRINGLCIFVVGVVRTIGAIVCFAIVAKIGVFVFDFKIIIEIVFLVAGFIGALAL
jgi:hypothetical protein